jgi:hypothetical protein
MNITGCTDPTSYTFDPDRNATWPNPMFGADNDDRMRLTALRAGYCKYGDFRSCLDVVELEPTVQSGFYRSARP